MAQPRQPADKPHGPLPGFEQASFDYVGAVVDREVDLENQSEISDLALDRRPLDCVGEYAEEPPVGLESRLVIAFAIVDSGYLDVVFGRNVLRRRCPGDNFPVFILSLSQGAGFEQRVGVQILSASSPWLLRFVGKVSFEA